MLIVNNINGVDRMQGVVVEQLRVLVDFPEDDLAVKAAGDHSVFGIRV